MATDLRAADASSAGEQGPCVQGHVAEEESQGLLSAQDTGAPDAESIQGESQQGDEEDQSRRGAPPGSLARIMKR